MIEKCNIDRESQKELLILIFLKSCFSSSLVYILKKTIIDFKNSISSRELFKYDNIEDKILTGNKINTTIVTTNIWDLCTLNRSSGSTKYRIHYS